MNSRQPRDPLGRFGPTQKSESDIVLSAPDILSVPSTHAVLDHQIVVARNVLITALEALGSHRHAITLIGAQAVLEHTMDIDGVPMTVTSDGDAAISPALIDQDADIGQALTAAGFVQDGDRPGIWSCPDSEGNPVGFDLLVPESVAGAGRRGARVHGQSKYALGRAAGLELSLLDREERTIMSLDGSGRSTDTFIAGVAALMCAKSYKLAERLADLPAGRRNRVKPKDAGDVWRLMAVSNPESVRTIFESGERHDVMGAAIRQGHLYLLDLFSATAVGIELAVRDLGDEVGEKRVRQVMVGWMQRFV